MYRDVETLLCGWLKTVLELDSVLPELPYNMEFRLPTIAVERFGGADDVLTLDQANVDVDVFHTSRQAAKDLAEQARRSLRVSLPGTTFTDILLGSVTVSRVQTISAPTIAPWDNAQIRRATASYRIWWHAHNLNL